LKRQILIVDDEEDFLILLKKIISKNCACDVTLATRGAQALEIIGSLKPDVVLTDIKIPLLPLL